MQDPQSLHKYLYVHGDPIQGVDPTGLLVSARGALIGTAIATLVVSFIRVGLIPAIRNAATGAAYHGASLRLRPLAESLRLPIKSRVDVKTERNRDNQYKWFVHGSESGAWAGLTGINFNVGGQGPLGSDFGIGFYTFLASTEGVDMATKRAQDARTNNPRGQGFIIVVRVLVASFNSMSKINLGTRQAPAANYATFVAANRSAPVLHNVNYIFGPTARQQPPGSGVWVAHPRWPEQYKFEISAAPHVQPYAIIPVI